MNQTANVGIFDADREFHIANVVEKTKGGFIQYMHF